MKHVRPRTPPNDERAARTQRRAQGAGRRSAASAWVSANAGTGKTHVLDEARAAPAARRHEARAHPVPHLHEGRGGRDVEARVRRLARLGDGRRRRARGRADRSSWADATDAEDRARARTLFARAIETPGGLKVQTIHAFCERLLQRFPLEAGVPPGFDDSRRRATRATLQREAIDAVLEARRADRRQRRSASALTTPSRYAADDAFRRTADAMRSPSAIGSKQRAARPARRRGPRSPRPKRYSRRASAFADGVDVPTHRPRDGDVLTDDEHRSACATLLAGGSKSDCRSSRASAQGRHRERSCRRAATASPDALLTGEGEPRADAHDQGACATSEPDLLAIAERAQRPLLRASTQERRGADRGHRRHVALLRLAGAVLQRYTDAKARRAALDFDDLIERRPICLLARRQSGASGCSTSSTAVSITSSSTRRRTRAPSSGRSSQRWRSEFFAGSGAREDVVAHACSRSATRSSRSTGSRARRRDVRRDGPDASRRSRAQRGPALASQCRCTLSFRTVAAAPRRRRPGVRRCQPHAGRDRDGAGDPSHRQPRRAQPGSSRSGRRKRSDDATPADPWTPLDETSARAPADTARRPHRRHDRGLDRQRRAARHRKTGRSAPATADPGAQAPSVRGADGGGAEGARHPRRRRRPHAH